MKGTVEFFLFFFCALEFSHPGNVWGEWEVCLPLRKGRMEGCKGSEERSPTGISLASHKELEDPESVSFKHPCLMLPGFLGSHFEDPCPELSSPQAPVPRRWGKWSKEIFVFHPCGLKRSNLLPIFSFSFLGRYTLTCKVNLFLFTNAGLFFSSTFLIASSVPQPSSISFFSDAFPSANKLARSLLVVCFKILFN